MLHLSEHAAYGRIEAARAARRFPVILELLAEGAVTLTTITLLARYLTEENHLELLAEARHRRKRDVEQIVARLQPRPDVPSTVRKLPTPARPQEETVAADQTCADGKDSDDSDCPRVAPSSGSRDEQRETQANMPHTEPLTRPAVIAPLAPTRYKVSFTISADTYAKLQQAQDLLRHVVPNGDPATLFDRALTLLLAECARTKLAATDKPRTSASALDPAQGDPHASTGSGSCQAQSKGEHLEVSRDRAVARRSRYIPAAVRREVWQRDNGQCAFVSKSGRRCGERGFLEFHHVVPYAKGGEASVAYTELRCRRHNAYEAAREFGFWPAARVREKPPRFGTRNEHDSVWTESRNKGPLPPPTSQDRDEAVSSARHPPIYGRLTHCQLAVGGGLLPPRRCFPLDGRATRAPGVRRTATSHGRPSGTSPGWPSPVDCLRKHREPARCSLRQPRARDGHPTVDRRRTPTPRTAAAGREPAARARWRRARSHPCQSGR